jgi:hypothetical protein
MYVLYLRSLDNHLGSEDDMIQYDDHLWLTIGASIEALSTVVPAPLSSTTRVTKVNQYHYYLDSSSIGIEYKLFSMHEPHPPDPRNNNAEGLINFHDPLACAKTGVALLFV